MRADRRHRGPCIDAVEQIDCDVDGTLDHATNLFSSIHDASSRFFRLRLQCRGNFGFGGSEMRMRGFSGAGPAASIPFVRQVRLQES
jgi:tRNA nucleotidyltransferase (CCA-adding enzyme)